MLPGMTRMESGFSNRRVRSICFGELTALLREDDKKRIYLLESGAQLSVLAAPR